VATTEVCHALVDHIWLIGLMGAGKSTVGRALAADIAYQYIDNDAALIELSGRTAVELALAGGNDLHEWETRYVATLPELPARHVAGVPASTADRDAQLADLRRSGLLVYLRCDVNTLVARVAAGEPRPWINTDAQTTLERMFANRDSLLREHCHVLVDGTRPVADVAAQIRSAATQFADVVSQSGRVSDDQRPE
jgi:shikimate kinase